VIRWTAEGTEVRRITSDVAFTARRWTRCWPTWPPRPPLRLAGALGGPAVTMPGGHAGFLTDPAEFAERLAGILSRP
jgi:hypothetical protein